MWGKARLVPETGNFHMIPKRLGGSLGAICRPPLFLPFARRKRGLAPRAVWGVFSSASPLAAEAEPQFLGTWKARLRAPERRRCCIVRLCPERRGLLTWWDSASWEVYTLIENTTGKQHKQWKIVHAGKTSEHLLFKATLYDPLTYINLFILKADKMSTRSIVKTTKLISESDLTLNRSSITQQLCDSSYLNSRHPPLIGIMVIKIPTSYNVSSS